MVLAINQQTNEAFIVKDLDIFSRDYAIALGGVWDFYHIDSVSKPFAVQLCKTSDAYVSIGPPWLEKTSFVAFQELQQKLNRIPNMDTISQVEAVKENALALIIELVELLQELPYKPWRKLEDQPFNASKALEELIDVFFFVFNISIAMTWTYADLVITMAYKMNKNNARIMEGYNKLD